VLFRSTITGVTAILGIDPGWAKQSDSGVALVGEPGKWRTLRVAPSFASFVSVAPGAKVSLDAVLGHAAQLGGGTIDVAAIDIPLAATTIASRRTDEEVSRRYGGRGCAVHSPTPARPGALADEYRHALTRAGLPLATTGTAPGTRPAALEVYPHVSLLRLMSADYRVPYKVGRARSYWKDIATAAARRTRLLLEWRRSSTPSSGCSVPAWSCQSILGLAT
jgi:predicted RNase H-like nuclease